LLAKKKEHLGNQRKNTKSGFLIVTGQPISPWQASTSLQPIYSSWMLLLHHGVVTGEVPPLQGFTLHFLNVQSVGQPSSSPSNFETCLQFLRLKASQHIKRMCMCLASIVLLMRESRIAN